MKIGFLNDSTNNEKRITLTPPNAKQLSDLGATLLLEQGFEKQLFKKEDFSSYNSTSSDVILKDSDIVIKLHPPKKEDLSALKKGAIHISFLDPFNSKDILDEAAKLGITLISLEMIPRTTRAQKMDVLSSQASLAGYAAVLTGANRLEKVFPMMMTPAGTLAPTKVFIIGAGVAGLQAIATARRLGARVEAFDTRPVVEEQVQSLGAKFVKVDLGDTGQTKDGYAKQLTEEQLAKQQEVMAKHCAMADLVITTAQVFGRKAPLIINKKMVNSMSKGSVIVDLAVETGGNVEGSETGKDVQINGVTIVGVANMPGEVALHASQMLSANITHLLTEFWNKETKTFDLNLEDEILAGCVMTHNGELVNERIKAHYG
ncbi:NAD(P)(+) transhydrogenase (Re/Si-specific) subunit alpha [Candidatus Marinamargulisbacteria bacterium SCGC AAA071-K20]|nr:NAD(P)(+) transhydrogenase (Re/Si-specific) subunit alpha [Candidatus Marinamargulisbacteria bacterium SCGC AAA071-K20]